jgi:amino acid permease
MFGYELRLFEKVLVIVNIILVIGILVAYFILSQNLVDNCWSKFQTEDQAVSHCESNG